MLSSYFKKNLTSTSSMVDAGITKVAKDILWIGCIDWDLREFHSMHVPIGTSYNSYVINGTQPTIIDSVEEPFFGQWVSRLQSLYGEDLKPIKYILLQHAEPDHTSALPMFLRTFPHIQLLCTQNCFNILSRFYGPCSKNWNKKIVKTNETISLGNKNIIMKGVPLAHWPEQCVTYLPEDKILFSSDAFGQHIATSKRFADELDPCLYNHEMRAYYGNILLRLKNPVLKALNTAASLPGINVILPAHGVGLRTQEGIAKAIENYTNWANQKPVNKLTLLYDCNWFGTEKMANAIASGASSIGVDVKMFHARKTHFTNVATEIIDSAGVAVGSAVLHESILPDLAGHINHLRCLDIHNKVGQIFGTYGWNKNVVPNEIRNQLYLPTKTVEVSQPIMVNWSPSDDDLRNCENVGKKLGEKIRDVCEKEGEK